MSLLLLKKRGFVRRGLVAYYDFRKQNLLDFSEEFGNAAWNATLVSATPDVAPAADGNLTADLLTPTGTNAFIRQIAAVSLNRDYTFSIHLKSTGADKGLRISIHDTGLSLISSQSITVTSSWQRFEVAANSGPNATLQLLVGGGSTWETGEDVHGWGAQLNEGTSVVGYQKTPDNQTVEDLSGEGNDLTLGSSTAAEADDPIWAQHKLVFDGDDVAQRSVTSKLPSGNNSLTMMVVAKMNALTAEHALLSYGDGLNGSTPAIRLNSSDHLVAGFSGPGWFAETTSPAGSQSNFHAGTLRYNATNGTVEAILNDFADFKAISVPAGPAATNEQLAIGSTFGGSDPSSAEIAQALVYDRWLSNEEVRRVYRTARQLLSSRGINLP